MERTSYWITIDEPDGTMMHVSETLLEAAEYIGSSKKDFSVERVIEKDVTEDVRMILYKHQMELEFGK